LVLAPVTRARLKYDNLLRLGGAEWGADAPLLDLLRSMFDVLRGRTAPPFAAAAAGGGRGSRLSTRPILAQGETLGFLRRAGRPPSVEDSPLHRSPVFSVPKKDGSGRFIMDCRSLNAASTVSWPCLLRPVRDLVGPLLANDWLGEYDASSWFHQFELAPRLARWFGWSVGCLRGIQATMPMGWLNAPAIAQAVALLLLSGLPGGAYIDNFFAGGGTEAECRRNCDTLAARCVSVGADVRLEQAPTQSPRVLGLELDLRRKRYRLDSAWIARAVPAWDGRARSRHAWAVVTGQVVYAWWVTGRPLGAVAPLVRFSAGLAGYAWSTVRPAPENVAATLLVAKSVIAANHWVFPASSTPPTVVISADASPMGGAASLLGPTGHVAWAWRWAAGALHQIHREAMATCLSLALAAPYLNSEDTILIVSDCVPWLQILSSGLSRSDALQAYSDRVWPSLTGAPRTAAVCSAHHWDDDPSRCLSLSPPYWRRSPDLPPPHPSLGPSPLFTHFCPGDSCAGIPVLELYRSQSAHGKQCLLCPSVALAR
jgi:hypothetical protein